MRRLYSFLFTETPLIVTVAISIFVSALIFYFLVPQPVRVVYSFDVEKFKKDLIARAGLYKTQEDTISRIVKDLRATLNSYAKQGKTLVVNRRAYYANGLEGVQIIDITQDVEKELFSKYFSSAVSNKKKLMEELLESTEGSKDR